MPNPSPLPAPDSPLAAVIGLAGAGITGTPMSLLETADRLDALHRATGYQSLATFARACREMHSELEKEGDISHE
jgi:hypothetical protein